MYDTKAGRIRVAGQRRPGHARPASDGVLWLALVAALFLLAELTPALLRMPLGADEITYIAKTSARMSAVNLPPVHGHGVGLLAAPVTLLTTSLVAMRIWLALLSAVALFLAMLCWRGLRPAWVIAVAGAILGSLAITQNSGVQVYPDWWGAVALLALTGLFLHAVNRTMRAGLVLTLIGVASFFIVLLRPQNIVFLLGPAIVAALVVPAWRRPDVLAAMGVGIVLGLAEWAAEAFLWFGGLASRIHLAGQEPPTLGIHFSFLTQVRVVSGPWYCETSKYCPGISAPGELLWYAAATGLVILGGYAVWRTSARDSSLLAVFTGLWVLVLFSFLVPFGAPRYLLPTFAVFAILAADGIAWLVTSQRMRTLGIAVACAFLLTGIVSQRFVLQNEIASQVQTRPFAAKAAHLRQLGVRPPCRMYSPFVAYYLGCGGAWTGETMHELLARSPQGLHSWRRLPLPGHAPAVYVLK